MKTYFETTESANAGRQWKVVDAAGLPVGRLATVVASLIRGKHRPQFTPHADGGDFVIVLNAEKAIFTGKKAQQKFYYHHSGYIGGIKSEQAAQRLQRKPELVIEHAVIGMLPGGVMGHRLAKKLKVFRGAEHPHAAQNPTVYVIKK
jgi:large subunit ribosomal protein L13